LILEVDFTALDKQFDCGTLILTALWCHINCTVIVQMLWSHCILFFWILYRI